MKLEDFINEHRPEFDSAEPSAAVWERISQRLPKPQASAKKTFAWRSVLRIAASVIFLVGVGYFIGQNRRAATEDPDIARLSPTYAKQVTQYTTFINEKRDELRKLAADDPELYANFRVEIDSLDADYNRLKSCLPKNPNQEELLNAMLENLQWQMNILNQQLEIIHKVNAVKNEKAKEMV